MRVIYFILFICLIVGCDGTVSSNEKDKSDVADSSLSLKKRDTSSFSIDKGIEKMRQSMLSKADLTENDVQEINKLCDQMILDYISIDSIQKMLLGRSPSVLTACFQGTQNQAKLIFREDNSFDIFWTGVFGGYSLHEGFYKLNGDIYTLDYTTGKPNRFGTKIKNTGMELIVLDTPDSNQYFVKFHIGDWQIN